MPLTEFQAELAALLSKNRSKDNYLAGGAAFHIASNGVRYSNDLDYFCDSEQRVLEAFEHDYVLLKSNEYIIVKEIDLAGYIRAIVSRDNNVTKIEWAHDSAWRFLPTVFHDQVGYMLTPVDLAVNKTLALAGRDEARDFLDVIFAHKNLLSLGALCWAAAGKDPGFTPHNLLELLKRRGRYQPGDFARLQLTQSVEIKQLKSEWLDALDQATAFVHSRPPEEIGCLYYSPNEKNFVTPDVKNPNEIVLHFGQPGGVLPSTD